MNEIWKDIKGYENCYQVSNLGNVRSVSRVIQSKNGHGIMECTFQGKILSLGLNKKGYLSVGLSKNGKGKTYRVHRLVAEAFIPNPMNLPQVNHKDENTANNRVENLEWCTNKYNINYGNWKKHQSEIRINHPRYSKRVKQIDEDGNVIMIFPSISEAKRITGISHIGTVANGKRNTSGGYRWEFEKANNKVSQKALEKFNRLLEIEEVEGE